MLFGSNKATSIGGECDQHGLSSLSLLQVNLDMTNSMGPGKLVRHMQNPSYTYDKYLICIGLGPSISSVICKNLSYSGPSYPSSPVLPFPKLLLLYFYAIPTL